ncbi:MAG: hypothetical protein FWF47_07525 [Clostridia bacterium]|nr:hypothetical protein [Clostridia bacterium]
MESARQEARDANKKAFEAAFKDQPEEALRLLRENVSAFPCCYTLNNLACYLLCEERYPSQQDCLEASVLLRRSLQRNPRDYHTLSLAGYAAWKLHRIPEAHEMYTLAVQQHPTAESLYFLALLSFERKYYTQAADCFARLEPYIQAMKVFQQENCPLADMTEAESNHYATDYLYQPYPNIYSLWVSCLVWAGLMPEAREVAKRSILLESYCNPDEKRSLAYFETGSFTAYTLLEEYETLHHMLKLICKKNGRIIKVFYYPAQEEIPICHTHLPAQAYFIVKRLIKQKVLSDKTLLKEWRKDFWEIPSIRRRRLLKRGEFISIRSFSLNEIYQHYKWRLGRVYLVYIQRQLLELPFIKVGVPDLKEMHYSDYPETTNELVKFKQEMDRGMHINPKYTAHASRRVRQYRLKEITLIQPIRFPGYNRLIPNGVVHRVFRFTEPFGGVS